MELFDAVLNLLRPLTFLAMSIGVAWGIICGALPGLGATIGIALLIPFTFGMDPTVALPMLAGVLRWCYLWRRDNSSTAWGTWNLSRCSHCL